MVEQERNKAINADEIIKSFITQEIVNNPLEFVKQICYQTTGNMPVYYYLSLADQSTDFALSFIETVPINSAAKDLLKRRIAQRETKYCKISSSNTEPSKKKRRYLQEVLDESLAVPADETELKYCMSAMRALSVVEIQEHKNYILDLLQMVLL